MSPKPTRRRFLAGAAAATAGAMTAGFPTPRILRAAESRWGDLVGRFVYDGKAPERKKLTVDKDVDCCGKFDIRDESLMVGADGGLANAFVYVRSRKVDVCPELEKSLPKRVILDNIDCIFKPHCTGIWCNRQEFCIVNSDPVAQNVDFKPIGDTQANIVLPAYDAKKSPDKKVEAAWKFHKLQIVPILIKCNYHPWESGYITIRDNPYHALSAADGTFRISKLPVGKLEFQLWQERVGYLDAPGWPKGRRELAIKPGTNDLGTIAFPSARFEMK